MTELEDELNRKVQALQKAEHQNSQLATEMSRKIESVRGDCDYKLQQSGAEARRLQVCTLYESSAKQ